MKGAHLVQVFLQEMAGEVTLAGSLLLFSTRAPTKNSCRLLVKAKRRDMCSGCTHPGVSGEHRVRHQRYSVQKDDLLVDLGAKLGYLGFGHYRGFCLHDVAVKHSSFSARLGGPKPIGEDRELTFRPVYVDAVCHILQSEWIPVGWALLQRLAYIPRGCLLPTPSSSYQGCRRSELKHETGFALCKRIFRAARSGTERS